jgi:hypothetical protein
MGPKPPIETSVSADVKDTVTDPLRNIIDILMLTSIYDISSCNIQNVICLEGLSPRQTRCTSKLSIEIWKPPLDPQLIQYTRIWTTYYPVSKFPA